MPLVRLISGSGWNALDGQTLTTANSGPNAATRFTSVSAGAWTIRAGNPLPPGSSATGYLESAAGAGGSLQLDAAGTGLAGSPPSGDQADYWIDFWLMGIWDGATQLPVAQSDFLFLAVSGYYVNARLCCNGASTPTFNPPGWALATGNSVGTSARALYLRGDAAESVSAKWGDWNRITLHLRYGAAGAVEIFQNGVLVSSTTSDTTQITWSTQTLAITLPAWSGVKWRVAGPLQSWNGVDLPVRPNFELDADFGTQVSKCYLPFNTAAASGATQGAFFQASGTGSLVADALEYAAAADSAYRRRLVFSGNGSSPVATTIDELGELPVNEDGWAHIAFTDLYVPAGTTLQGQLLAPGGAASLSDFFITGGVLYYRRGAEAYLGLAPWNATVRQALLLHFHRDGRARFTLIDVTSSITGSGKSIWSGPLPDWTPQSLGALRLSATTTASNVETGMIAICRRPTLTLVDSLTVAPYSAVTPALQVSTSIARMFPFGEERTSIPGGWWPQKEAGLARRCIIASLGRSGLTQRDWSHSALSGLTHTCGVELLVCDGGLINDIAGIGGGTADATLSRIEANLTALIDRCLANDIRLWMTTTLPRTRSASITAASNASPIVLTAPNHGLAGSATRAVVSGVVGNTAANGIFASATINDANTITLNGTTGSGAYSSGGIIAGYTPQELGAIDEMNERIRAIVTRKQERGLLALSDIARDAQRNPALYPATGSPNGFWQDFTHPSKGYAPRGAGAIAERMVRLRVVPSPASRPRRWSSAR